MPMLTDPAPFGQDTTTRHVLNWPSVVGRGAAVWLSDFRSFCLVACVMIMTSTSSANADALGFTLENRSGEAVVSMHVSPDWKRDWGADQLGGAAIEPGNSKFMTIIQEDGYCYFDVLVSNSGGETHTFWFVDACSRETLVYLE